MATRYSGNLRITCTYRDRGDYKCTVTPHGGKAHTVFVNPPASGYGPGISYDSPEAYDRVAHAAIAFAADDERGLDDSAEPAKDGSGYAIHRSLPSYSPFVRTAAQVDAVRAQRAAGKTRREEERPVYRLTDKGRASLAAWKKEKAELAERRDEMKNGSFIVRVGKSESRWNTMQRAMDNAHRQLKNWWVIGRPAGLPNYAARFFRASDPERVFHVEVIDDHGHIRAAPLSTMHGGGGANLVGDMGYYAAGGGARAGSTTKNPIVGRRVEIHPRYDLWMRGAKYGNIQSVSKDGKIAYVKMDHPGVKKLAGILVEDLTFEGGPSPGAGWTRRPSGRWVWKG